MMQYSKLIGVGGYLPGEKISNQALAERLAKQGVETSDEWIQSRTGIAFRHFAESNQRTSDLSYQAAIQAMAQAGIDASQLDLILVATSTPDMIFPSTACLLQQKLGNRGAAAMDVQAVCAGFTYALAVADSMIGRGLAKRALVIGAEVFSGILDWQDRTTCVLFGDGAGAVILEASDKPGILACCWQPSAYIECTRASALWQSRR
jgi:3-oxoacyl-[acyl-carrier-protein] synthase III